MKTLEERFLSKIEKTDSCWIWKGAKTRGNYGHLRYKNGGKWVMKRAHIVSYTLYKGDVKDSIVCHSCDNPSCVNPDHLWTGTRSDNSQDMVAKGRYPKSKPMAKLSWEQVLEIRELAAKGATQKELAKSFSIKPNTVSMIVNNKRWIE